MNMHFTRMLPVMMASLAVMNPSATAAGPARIAFCGDSITQGVTTVPVTVYGYRYQVFKNFVDNGIAYDPVGSHESSGGISPIPAYGGKSFGKANEGHSGWWASHLNGDDDANRSSIKHWTGQSTALGGGKTYSGSTHKPETVFIMAGTNDILHKNQASAPDTDTVVSRILKCVSLYKTANPKAHIYVSAILPQEIGGFNSWNPAEYNKRVREVNEQLKRLSSSKSYTFVESDQGFRSASDEPVTEKSFTGDNLHPNAQGELIIAGNVARALGVGQRTAGLIRKPAAALPNVMQRSSVQGAAWKQVSGQKGLVAASDKPSWFRQDWAGRDLSRGFTCDVRLQILPQSSVEQPFSIQVSDGTSGGSLHIAKDRVSWGQTVLYLASNSDAVHSFRLVSHPGNKENGIPGGTYVWRDGVLIGEALPVSASLEQEAAGLKAGLLSSGGGAARLMGCSWDIKGAFAPETTVKRK